MRIPTELLTRCWFLAGPTACGKTDLSRALARRLDAEIVALDSMTVYRGMDVGTAKPSAAERAATPHHLLDLVDPHEEFSVADFLEAAAAACADIVSRGKTPLFVGGTGLYLRAGLRGVFDGPPADWDLRRRLEAEAAQDGNAALHRRLAEIDPPTAARLAPADLRRVIRALEVAEVTGRPLSDQHQQQPLPLLERPPAVWLSPPRAWLHDRIHRRIDAMFASGLVEEVRHLLALPQGMGRTARQGLGYKEVIDHLEERVDEATMIDTLRTRTRQFAKRQHTWFRNLEECRAIEIDGAEPPEALAARIVATAR